MYNSQVTLDPIIHTLLLRNSVVNLKMMPIII